MEARTELLALLLTLAGLIAATTEYAHLVRRRAVRDTSAVDRRALEASGLPALVRVFIVGDG